MEMEIQDINTNRIIHAKEIQVSETNLIIDSDYKFENILFLTHNNLSGVIAHLEIFLSKKIVSLTLTGNNCEIFKVSFLDILGANINSNNPSQMSINIYSLNKVIKNIGCCKQPEEILERQYIVSESTNYFKSQFRLKL